MPTASAVAPAPRPRVLIVGDVMLDRYYEGSVDRISPEAPVPVLHVRRVFHRPGGAANVAVNVAAMGGDVRLVGATGDDEAGRRLREVLAADGVDGADLVAAPGGPTTVKTRLIASHNQIARFDEERRLDDPAARERILARTAAAVEAVDLVLLSDYLKGVCDPAVCRAVIDRARSCGIPVIVDSKNHDYEIFRGTTVITPNRHEAAAAAGCAIRTPEDGLRAARTIRERFGIAAAVVTLGEQGMVFVTDTEADVIPTRARQVYDVTGAGDSVVAALSVALGKGFSMRQACLLANAAAGLQVARVGTSRITWEEMAAALHGEPAMPRGKIVGPEGLREAVRQARAAGRRIGFTNGCFDILHQGHVRLLGAAAAECDLLVVGVNSDASVRRLKGPSRPLVPAAGRMAVLAGLEAVDLVCEFDADTPLELVRLVEPDVIVKGADYRPEDVVGADIVLARGGRVVTPPLVPDASTTGLVDRIRGGSGSGGG